MTAIAPRCREGIIACAMRRNLFVIVTLLLSNSAKSQCIQYSVNVVSPPPCSGGSSGATGWAIAQDGSVAGDMLNCSGIQKPFGWFGSGPLATWTLPAPYGTGQSRGINSSHMVVGWMHTISGSGSRHAFKALNGVASDLLGPPGVVEAEAHAVNENGVIVGNAAIIAPQATMWQGGLVHTLTLPIGPSSNAEGVNDINQICGWMGVHPSPSFSSHAFIWDNGVVTDLGIPEGATATTANALNNHGDACGYAIWPDVPNKYFLRRACAWIDGQFVDLGMLPGFNSSIALDINDAGEIVGYCRFEDATTAYEAPFIWRDGMMTALSSLLPPGSLDLHDARAINNLGQIVGSGSVNPGGGVAYRLTPAMPAHAGDTDCDDAVNINDLLNVINRWNPLGPVGGEPADLNRDNKIDHADLLETILHWGQ